MRLSRRCEFRRCLAVAIAACASLSVFASPSATQSLPPADAFADESLSGAQSLEEFDFAAAGYWSLSSGDRLAWRSPVERKLFGASLDSDTCNPSERRRFAAAMWLQLLSQSQGEAGWLADWRSLRDSLRRLDDDVENAGKSVPAKESARTTELARRIARDQIVRDPEADARWSAGLTPVARGLWLPHKLSRMMEIDCGDTEWLAAQVREIGLFDIPTHGAAADKDAWLLVQHADRTPAFQREMLDRLRALPPGHTDPRNLAYLEDRVATAEKRPQRYGTQGQCVADGRWLPLPIEDPSGVDTRRKFAGLPPMDEYAKQFEGVCPKQ